jgi:hypothetical protein
MQQPDLTPQQMVEDGIRALRSVITGEFQYRTLGHPWNPLDRASPSERSNPDSIAHWAANGWGLAELQARMSPGRRAGWHVEDKGDHILLTAPHGSQWKLFTRRPDL